MKLKIKHIETYNIVLILFALWAIVFNFTLFSQREERATPTQMEQSKTSAYIDSVLADPNSSINRLERKLDTINMNAKEMEKEAKEYTRMGGKGFN